MIGREPNMKINYQGVSAKTRKGKDFKESWADEILRATERGFEFEETEKLIAFAWKAPD
jgi:hypothetical protein